MNSKMIQEPVMEFIKKPLCLFIIEPFAGGKMIPEPVHYSVVNLGTYKILFNWNFKYEFMSIFK